MAITQFNFNPLTGLNDTSVYETTPASEAAARAQIQGIPDQIRDYINNTLRAELESGGEIVGHVVGARFVRINSQQVLNETDTLINWTHYIYNPDSSQDGTYSTRMVCKYPGVYTVSASVMLQGGVEGDNYQMRILKNGSPIGTIINKTIPTTQTYEQMQITEDCIELAVDDYLEVSLYQNTGTFRLIMSTISQPVLSMRRNIF